jgi:hypothetical protein
MLHDELVGKREIRENNKNFWKIGDIFWKDTEQFINKFDDKTQK